MLYLFRKNIRHSLNIFSIYLISARNNGRKESLTYEEETTILATQNGLVAGTRYIRHGSPQRLCRRTSYPTPPAHGGPDQTCARIIAQIDANQKGPRKCTFLGPFLADLQFAQRRFSRLLLTATIELQRDSITWFLGKHNAIQS